MVDIWDYGLPPPPPSSTHPLHVSDGYHTSAGFPRLHAMTTCGGLVVRWSEVYECDSGEVDVSRVSTRAPALWSEYISYLVRLGYLRPSPQECRHVMSFSPLVIFCRPDCVAWPMNQLLFHILVAFWMSYTCLCSLRKIVNTEILLLF